MKKILIVFISLVAVVVGCSDSKIVDGTLSVNTYLQSIYFKDDYKSINKYACGVQELSRPNKLTLYLSGSDSYEVKLNEIDKNGGIASVYATKTSENSIDLFNFKINTDYTYTIDGYINETYSTSFTSPKFTIGGSIRNIYVSGVTNFRDLGGKKNTEGKTIKQGLLYRSGEWNYSNQTTNRISEKGIKTVQEQLKIKSEIDLRNCITGETGGITESPVPGVAYKNILMSGHDIKEMINAAGINETFAFLSDINNYPADFHCAIGTDRTGLLAFCINAILGVSEEDIYKDYLFSNFGNIGSKRDETAIQVDINKIGGDKNKPLKERVEYYLINSVGVKQEHIDAIRKIMIEN